MISAKDIKDKTYLELSTTEDAYLRLIINKLGLVTSERNIVWLALMFGDTIFESLKRVRCV